jgi:hypothetical protein
MNFEPTRTRAQLMLVAQDMAGSGDFPENHGAAIARIAEIVGVLCERVDALEQQVCAVMEQQGLQATGWNPVPLADFLPEGPEHFHTGDDGPCWGADCFTASVSVDADQAGVQ